MAIAFDAVTINTTASESSSTVSHTAAAGATAILVGVFNVSGSDIITSVTWNGNAMTQINKVINTPSGNSIYLYAIAGSDTGTHDVVVTRSSATVARIHVASYTGTHATTGSLMEASATNTAAATTTITGTVTVSTSNAWTVMFGRNDQGNFSAGASTTLRGAADSSQIFDSNAGLSPGSESLIGTWSGSGAASVVIASMVPPATPTFIPKVLMF